MKKAESRHGLLTRDDLMDADVSDASTGRLVRSGRLVDCGYGVYRVGGMPETFASQVLAAVLAVSSFCWASHHTAARLLGLERGPSRGRIELVRPTGLSAELAAARIHRSTRLPAHHLTVVDGIGCTTASRTIFDLARTTGPAHLTRLVNAGLLAGLCTMVSLYRVLYDLGGRGRPGTARMRQVLDALGDDHVPPESGLEEVGMALLGPLGFAWQVVLSDEQGYIRRVDGLHRASGVIVEFDGPQHRREPQRSLDRAHDERLRQLGHEVVRLEWEDVTRRGESTRTDVLARIDQAVA